MADSDMYHEKQHLMHCAVHTLNNLFQENWATASLLEGIAKDLFDRETDMRREAGMGGAWINPYKSLIPRAGYYDINVLLEALKTRNCKVCLHAVFNPKDPHAVARSIEALDPSSCSVRGVVVNRVSTSLLGSLMTTHHYYAVVPRSRAPDDLDIRRDSDGDTSETDCPGMDALVKIPASGEGPTRESTVPIEWYMVDSKASGPELIGSTPELALHLQMEAREHQAHVFVVSDGNDPPAGAELVEEMES